MANAITATRIALSFFMLFSPVFSPRFYIMYILCGLSDMVDGTVARLTKSAGSFGARLDTAADFVFAAVCLVKILPAVRIPKGLWLWVIVIAAVKIINAISGFILHKKLVSQHTVLNKITGFFVFLLPLTANFANLEYTAPPVCLMATLAALREGYCIITGRENN